MTADLIHVDGVYSTVFLGRSITLLLVLAACVYSATTAITTANQQPNQRANQSTNQPTNDLLRQCPPLLFHFVPISCGARLMNSVWRLKQHVDTRYDLFTVRTSRRALVVFRYVYVNHLNTAGSPLRRLIRHVAVRLANRKY